VNRDPQSKIDRILGAAVAEFARSGKDGARIDAIAAVAGMNKRMLYHYVGGKAALFESASAVCLEHLSHLQTGPGISDTDAWRVLCHAVAAGSPLDYASLVKHYAADSQSTDLSVINVALVLLHRLLPDLAAALRGVGRGGHLPGESSRELLERIGLIFASARPVKPRIKLKPELRPVHEATERSASNRSK